MQENMTGFNPGLVRSQITSFKSAAVLAGIKIGDIYGELIDNLKYYWASPKAKQFCSEMTPKVENVIWELDKHIRSVINGIVNAYNYAAFANGVPTTSYNDYEGIGFDCGDLEESKDGMVGMNVEVVRDNVIPAFKDSMKEAVDALNALPRSIALYDDENGQQHYYSIRIDNIVTQVENAISEVVGAINSAIESETDNILLAKQQATDALSE